MPNPLHAEFLALLDALGGAEECEERFDITPRTMERFVSGSKPPPNSLLDEMRDALADDSYNRYRAEAAYG